MQGKKKMISNPATIAQFVTATDGNWRNSIYVECHCYTCPRPEGCGDVLFAVGDGGQCVVLPVPDVEVIWDCGCLDKTDCLMKCSSAVFKALCQQWLCGTHRSEEACPLLELIKQENALGE